MRKVFLCLVMVTAGTQLNAASLIVNGSFETRTTPPAPTSSFSSGVPDFWTDSFNGNTYLVHESHGTVPGNSAIDGEIIVGGGNNIVLIQNFTTVNLGKLQVSWWANNETIEAAVSNFHSTAVQFTETDGTTFIEWSEFRDNANTTSIAWVNHTFTTSTVFAPGNYQVQFFIGGRSSADDLIVTQIPVPEPSGYSLLGLAAAGLFFRRRR